MANTGADRESRRSSELKPENLEHVGCVVHSFLTQFSEWFTLFTRPGAVTVPKVRLRQDGAKRRGSG